MRTSAIFVYSFCMTVSDEITLSIYRQAGILMHILHIQMPPPPSSLPVPFSQAFIHPILARFFWSSRPYSSLHWATSPYAYCNGTYTTNYQHDFTHLTTEPSGFVFIDYAGSGLVHLCGKMGRLASFVNSRCLGAKEDPWYVEGGR